MKSKYGEWLEGDVSEGCLVLDGFRLDLPSGNYVAVANEAEAGDEDDWHWWIVFANRPGVRRMDEVRYHSHTEAMAGVELVLDAHPKLWGSGAK